MMENQIDNRNEINSDGLADLPVLHTECYQRAEDYYQNPDLNHMNDTGNHVMQNNWTVPNDAQWNGQQIASNQEFSGYGNPGGMNSQQMYYNPKDYISPEDNKKANMFCWISLGLFLTPFLLAIVFEALKDAFDFYDVENAVNILSGSSGLFYLGALVFMIIVRVKYPKNVFGKVLMWIYITITIISIIAVAVMIVACSIACNVCMEEIQGCGCIGFVLLQN